MTARASILESDAKAARKAAIRSAILGEPILRTLASLAMPTIAVLVAQTMVGVIETYYVSRLGTDALVGVSVVFPIWMLMTMMSAGGIGGGVASAVARAIGAGRDVEADDLVLHAIAIAVVMGATFSVGMWVAGPAIYALLGATGNALTQALRYSNWIFLCSVPIWIVNLCSAALRGAGNVRTPALLSFAGILVLVGLELKADVGFALIGAAAILAELPSRETRQNGQVDLVGRGAEPTVVEAEVELQPATSSR